ncbi:hypothetical protein CDD80_4918 [Ophiocordyceps camponoti-rufipedis]|uniref:Uncharacterized protein n=1 Tax=Ophiocordyceps camponoti-rufipedis TaxID=2004952 RepID=A0A2C5YWJ0_9HYPO|nr:hypothetical protein CDD80_4918 [Ophiocordyceps camponoti-rufipedis]
MGYLRADTGRCRRSELGGRYPAAQCRTGGTFGTRDTKGCEDGSYRYVGIIMSLYGGGEAEEEEEEVVVVEVEEEEEEEEERRSRGVATGIYDDDTR